MSIPAIHVHTDAAARATPAVEGLPEREALAAALEHIEAEARHAAAVHYRDARRWRRYQVLGGSVAALLATSAGITGMTETLHPTLVGLKAIAAAAIGAAMTAMDPSRRAEEARVAHTKHRALFHRAHRVRSLDLPTRAAGDIRPVVEELAEIHDTLNAESPPVLPRAVG